jgi:AcrR family transcriptional regulator
MAMTPWGESETLRERRLKPGPGVERAEVERNQRERLLGATVAVVAERGYAAASITELIGVAGVSRTTFYKYFADKEAAMLATLEAIVETVLAVTAGHLREEADPRLRAETAVRAFMELLVAQPDAARLCLVESYAAGPRAVALIDGAVAEFERMLQEVFETMPDKRDMPPEITAAMVGGVRKLMHTRLHRRTERELLEVAGDLVDLGLRYDPPPGPLLTSPRRRRKRGRAEAPAFDEPAERIERATMAVVAERGYGEATMAAIAAEAGVSLRTFYATFEDKAAAFEAALMRCRLRMEAAALPGYRRSRDWPEGVAALVRACLTFLEAEPDVARLLTVDVYSAGEGAVESLDRAIELSLRFIEAGSSPPDLRNPIAAEGIQSAVYALLAARVKSDPEAELRDLAPLAIYIVLVPYLGAQRAYELAIAHG